MKRTLQGYRVGEDHQKAKLTDAQVLAMRADYVPGRLGGYRKLAEKYGCGESTARDIVKNRTRPDFGVSLQSITNLWAKPATK